LFAPVCARLRRGVFPNCKQKNCIRKRGRFCRLRKCPLVSATGQIFLIFVGRFLR
jgi:hypothetical protein